MEIPDTFGFLLGTWDVSRSYTDHRSGTTASFRGQAVLATGAAGPGRARYQETGQLCLGSHQGPAGRSLEYDRRPDGTVLLYRPGRQPYVDLDLSTGAWDAVHPCGADRYQISTIVRSPDFVQEYWRVQGPDKDYTAVTSLHRISVRATAGRRRTGSSAVPPVPVVTPAPGPGRVDVPSTRI